MPACSWSFVSRVVPFRISVSTFCDSSVLAGDASEPSAEPWVSYARSEAVVRLFISMHILL